MCVVPVRLRHRTWEDKEIEVYALLDECSEGTFISKSLLEKFDEGIKRKTSVEVETVNLKKEVEAYAVRNLIARGSEEFGAKYKPHDFCHGGGWLVVTFVNELEFRGFKH